jgi:prepilin-type N-terminal cleavage/methylation domain-containing protein
MKLTKRMRQSRRSSGGSGFTLLEVLIASTVLTIALVCVYGLMTRDNQISQSTVGISVAEQKAQAMLYGLERELADARGANPKATLTANLGAGNTASVSVDSTLGFPAHGRLLVDRGTANVECVSYASLGPAITSFVTLVRGDQCTQISQHVQGAPVMWEALAEPIEIQNNPPANMYDGKMSVGGSVVYFRGSGTGFSYRVPTDPTGGTNYMNGDNVQWGAQLAGHPTLNGWSALVFSPRFVLDESKIGHDIDKNGSMTDLFDVGQIRKMTWDTSNPAAPVSDIALGPSVILQRRCSWGADLDGDGFADPLFLWDAHSQALHVRLFVLGHSVENLPIVRKVEATIFLRNEVTN